VVDRARLGHGYHKFSGKWSGGTQVALPRYQLYSRHIDAHKGGQMAPDPDLAFFTRLPGLNHHHGLHNRPDCVLRRGSLGGFGSAGASLF